MTKHHPRPAETPVYNTDFLSDDQLIDLSWTAGKVRAFLQQQGGYFQNVVKDSDGTDLDLAEVISGASQQYHINPKVLLATLQKESSGVTRTTRPNMAALMGNAGGSTGREQVFEAARLFDKYRNSIASSGQTPSGWAVGVSKKTEDGVNVTPASAAVACKFTYTPYVGKGWGGNMEVGGVYLFYSAWQDFDF